MNISAPRAGASNIGVVQAAAASNTNAAAAGAGAGEWLLVVWYSLPIGCFI